MRSDLKRKGDNIAKPLKAWQVKRPRPISSLGYDREMLVKRYHRFAKSKVLGEGCFGTAMTHPKDKTKVIKIGSLNDGWLIWAAYCQLMVGTSPHLMKVYSVNRYEKHNLYVAVIERLEKEINDTPLGHDFRRSISHAFSNGLNHDKPDACGCWVTPVGVNYFNTVIDKNNWHSLWETLEPIRQFARDNGLCRDLHGRNAMLRSDGTVVITDPFSDGNDKARRALASMEPPYLYFGL